MEWIKSKLEGDINTYFLMEINKLLIHLYWNKHSNMWNAEISNGNLIVKLNIEFEQLEKAKVKSLEYYYKFLEVKI